MSIHLYNTLIELFPKDIINTILHYSNNGLIIKLQQYFPHSLKHIIIFIKELYDIHINNYQYIIKLNCTDFCSISDGLICHLPNLKELKCSYCQNITDASISQLANLMVLQCDYCPNITDISIQQLEHLTELDCS